MKTNASIRVAAIAAPLALCVPAVAGDLLLPTSQVRNVEAYAIILGDADERQEFMAPDFQPYVAQAVADVTRPTVYARATADQDSQISGDRLAGTCMVVASAENPLTDATCWSGYSVTFEVTEPVDWVLSGTLVGNDPGSAFTDTINSYARLGRQGGLLFQNHRTSGPAETIVLAESGYMAPGVYVFSFGTSGIVRGDHGLSEVDGLADLELTVTPRTTPYCQAALNSAGTGAALSTASTVSIQRNNFTIDVAGAVPNGFGLLYYGPNQIQVPFGDGFRCVGGGNFRVQPPRQADVAGDVAARVDFEAPIASMGPGTIVPESTWNFQYWYRDPMGPGGTGFNLSDGLAVRFVH